MDLADERLVGAPLFPFEGEMRRKQLLPLLDAEIPRSGEGDRPCERCGDITRGVIWSDDRWLVSAGPPSVNPVTVFLESRAHVDLDQLDESMAAELGILTVRLEAAIRRVSGVGRVHVHRWADGSSHLHIWFVARPERRVELYGWGNVLWSQILPPLAPEVIETNLAIVAEGLARG